jgi:hypothetical protein
MTSCAKILKLFSFMNACSLAKIRGVLRLTHALGMSRRLVGEATGVGKTAVGDYVRRAAMAGLHWPIPDTIDDADLERRLFAPTEAGSSAARTDPDWSHIHAEMKRRGVTLALLWQSIEASTPKATPTAGSASGTATGASASRRRCARRLWPARSCSSIGLATPSRYSIPITGGGHGARIFVAALGASNYTYAEARWTETLPDWIGAL